jgi:parallel beta-helix repeat protein
LLIKNVRVEWTNGPDESNGAYGLYPVQCKNVVIDGSVAIGASDAGIYVGQSNHVIVKNSRAEFNVAGIEIENTINADVFDNIATNNTGGILVFNMPNLPQPGSKTRVFHNQIFENNTRNFAPQGTAVSSVPAGSGVVVNSNDQVEIFENDIRDNATANIIISSYFATGYSDSATSDAFDPYPESIYIYDNRFSGGGDSPDGLNLKALKVAMFGLNGRLPDILWDGYQNESLLVDGEMPVESSICVDNGEAVLLNADLLHESKNVSVDMSAHQCTLAKLPEIKLSLPNSI